MLPPTEGKHMNDLNHPPRRDALDFLPMRRRAIPVVETPSRWSEFLMSALYLAACALAAFVIFSV